MSAGATTVLAMTARFAPFANRFCASCGRPIEQAWQRQPNGSFVAVDLIWCEPCELGLAADAPWPVELRVVEDGYPGHPEDARPNAACTTHTWVHAGVGVDGPRVCARCLEEEPTEQG